LIRFFGSFVFISLTILTACISLDQPKAVSDCTAKGCLDLPKGSGGKTAAGGSAKTGGSFSMGGRPQTGGVEDDESPSMGGHLSTGGNTGADTAKINEDTLQVLPAADGSVPAVDGSQIVDLGLFDTTKSTDSASVSDSKLVMDSVAVQEEAPASPSVPLALKLPGIECTSSQMNSYWCSGSTTCYSYCGPDKQGHKKLSCKNNKFGEEKCVFANAVNYACYKIKNVKACKNGPPKIGSNCSEPICQPCGSSIENAFQDTNGNNLAGFCVCTGGKWACGAIARDEWPCDLNSPKPGC
jgi:hypothetical protein